MDGCGVVAEDGSPCALPVEPGAPVKLCTRHLLEAHDWVVRDVGVTDLLPSPCMACGSRLGVRYPSGWLCGICEWRVGDIPDGSSSTLRVDVVYYIRYRDRIKIGTSGNPRLRLGSLLHEEVLGFERGGRVLEQRRHAQFAEHRFAGSEWFRDNPELRDHVRAVTEGVSDPWERYAFWVSQELALHG
jgi:hypothetical protein